MKDTDELLSFLNLRLQKPLPGWSAQKKMSPSGRHDISHYNELIKNAKTAATMLLLFRNHLNELNTVLIKRTERGVHSGQISFPGGKFEEDDNDFSHTAIRETAEELGLENNKISIIGKLSNLYVPPSNFLIHPFVGYYTEVPTFNIQKEEVSSVLICPLFFLQNKDLIKEKSIKLSGSNILIKTPCFDFFGHDVWGATAMILGEFVEIYNEFEIANEKLY